MSFLDSGIRQERAHVTQPHGPNNAGDKAVR